MPCGGINQVPVFRVKYAVKQCDEHICPLIQSNKTVVEFGQHLSRGMLLGDQNAKQCPAHRHKERCRDPFAGNIPDDHSVTIVTQLEKIEVVSSDFPGRITFSPNINRF